MCAFGGRDGVAVLSLYACTLTTHRHHSKHTNNPHTTPPPTHTHTQVDASKPLPTASRIRGAYVNSQSKDVGPDRPLN